MAMALIDVSKIGSDSYVADMTIGTDSISVRVKKRRWKRPSTMPIGHSG